MKMDWTTEKKGSAVTKENLETADKIKNEIDKVNFGKEQEEWNKQYAKAFLKKRTEKSRICCGLWGDPKRGKTGVALDFPDRPIFVLDWDRGVESIWREHHGADERIKVFCPIVKDKDNIIDINKSEKNSLMFINMARVFMQENPDEKPVFVFDGVDTFHNAALLKVNPNPLVVTQLMPWQYGERNKTFNFMLEAVYSLPCDVIYITHKKERYLNNAVVGYDPVWKDWGGKLEQEISFSAQESKGEIKYVAKLLASRTNGNLVGTIWTVREGKPPNTVWHGIPELREGNI